MQEHHYSILQTIVGVFGMLVSYICRVDNLIHGAVAMFSFYGGALLVMGGLVHMFTGWSFIKWWFKRKNNK